MSKSRTVRIALVQHDCPPDVEPQHTLSRSLELIRQAAARGAQIVATQELFHLPYFPQDQNEAHFSLAQSIPGPVCQQLCGLAEKSGIHLIASLFEARNPGVYHNTAIMIDPRGAIVSTYRKMHIPDDPYFFEKYYFTPGDPPGESDHRSRAWPTYQTPQAHLGMLICWDQWFPEAARLVALGGAQILFFPTAIAWCDDEPAHEQARQHDAWITMHRAHAIANGIFVAAINRCGREGHLTFWGSSLVVDPMGQVMTQAGEHGESVVVVDCDLSMIDRARQAWPFLRDRRIDAYAGLTKRMIDQ